MRPGVRTVRAPLLLTFGVAIGVAACSGPPSEAISLWNGPQADGQRILVEPRWELLWVIGGAGDEILARPRLLTIRDSLVVWWDDFDHQVTAATLGGEVLWRFGRPHHFKVYISTPVARPKKSKMLKKIEIIPPHSR